MWKRLRRFWRSLGPGLITGAADDDPSGIATYSQAGAEYGYGQLWTALFILPLQTAVQEACARIGAVTGQGIAAVVRRHYRPRVLYTAVILVFIANTINIGADIGAMAAAAKLLLPMNFTVLVLLFTATTLTLEIFTSYKVYSKFLKWLVLSLIAYPLTVFIVREPWLEILKATFIPHFELTFAFLFIITGVLGTTISPYMFFWEASEEVEEEREKHRLSRAGRPRVNWHYLRNIRLDNLVGMLASQVGTWAIIVVAATVLNRHGLTDIGSAADAAKALEPLAQGFPYAGFLSKLLFAVGIIGLGLLSVPVLAGSAAYAIAETFSWREGLYLKLRQAHGFYGVIIVATLFGLVVNFLGVDPIRVLVLTAVINGFVAAPLIFLIGRIAENEQIMGEYRSGPLSKAFVRLAFFGMAVSALLMIFSFVRKF